MLDRTVVMTFNPIFNLTSVSVTVIHLLSLVHVYIIKKIYDVFYPQNCKMVLGLKKINLWFSHF